MKQKFFEEKKKVVFDDIEADFWYKDIDELFEQTRGNGSWTHFYNYPTSSYNSPDYNCCEITIGYIDTTGKWCYICDNPPIDSNNGDRTWRGNLYKVYYTDVQNVLKNGGELTFEWAATVAPLFELDENGDIKE